MQQPRVGPEMMREASICKMAGLLLVGLAPAYIGPDTNRAAREEGRSKLVNECLLIAGQFQAKAEKRCEDAARRDSLAGNT